MTISVTITPFGRRIFVRMIPSGVGLPRYRIFFMLELSLNLGRASLEWDVAIWPLHLVILAPICGLMPQLP